MARHANKAEQFGVSPSVVVIWAQRWESTGSISAKPSGGSVSPLEDHAELLLKLIAEQPDLTLDEVVAAMKRTKIGGSRTAVWRFFERHDPVRLVAEAPLAAAGATLASRCLPSKESFQRVAIALHASKL
jgi:hypothetical protein